MREVRWQTVPDLRELARMIAPMKNDGSVLLAVLAVELGDEVNVLDLLYEEHVFRDALGFRRVPIWVAIQAIQERDELAHREEEEADT
jgi:hypothetical protein